MHGLAQPLPLVLVLDAGRHTDAVAERHEDQVARRDRDESGEPRALGAERILEHLDEDVGALAHQLADAVGARRGVAVLGIVGLDDVGGVQERRALETDVDERCLHSGQHPRYTSLVEIARQTAPARALDEQFLKHAVLQQRRARLARAHVDHDLRAHGAGPSRAASIGASSSQVSHSGSPITPE